MKKKEMQAEAARERMDHLVSSVSRVILGKEQVVRMVVAALLARGHVLIEDIPGVGKTTLARTLAAGVKSSFRRIQFTSDLLPSDILGIKVYEPDRGEFRFMPGPIFNSFVLADEINRTTPRTQSALLEAMNESQVTIEGETIFLPRPFMVIATENPLEHHGSYPLPDSQLDRFLMSIQVGYPAMDSEREIISRSRPESLPPDFKPVMDADEVVLWQERADRVKIAPEIVDYILEIAGRTRSHDRLRLGASPRGSLGLAQAARSWALVQGRDFCLPDDVKALAAAVLGHRVIVSGPGQAEEKRHAAREVVEEVLEEVPAPY